jgi:hypothetical protein
MSQNTRRVVGAIFGLIIALFRRASLRGHLKRDVAAVAHDGGRLKKTTIVALARKLLVALWEYVTAGVVIEGAIVKNA